MKTMIKRLQLLVILCLVSALLGSLLSRTNTRAAVTDPGRAGALWTASFSDPYFMGTSMTSTPVVTNDAVYVVNRDTLYALSPTTGKTLYEVRLPLRMNSVCDPVLADTSLYIPLSGGVIVCVDIQKKKLHWTGEGIPSSSATDYQTLGRLYHHDGFLYAGTWAKSGRADPDLVSSEGVFFCVNASTGKTVWTYRDTDKPAGFYWNSAVAVSNRLYFMSEDGTLISHALTEKTVYETRSLTEGKEIRNGLIRSEDGRYLYTVSKNGTLYRVTLSSDGSIGSVDRHTILSDEASGPTLTCTSTPSLYKNRLYVGCAAGGYGYLCVIDANTLKPIYSARGPKNGEIKSHPLVIPVKNTLDTVHIYVTANEKNGALYMMKDDTQATSGELKTLFTPYSAKQYCLANVVANEEETLFYSNDSGTLFAIGETPISADIPKDIRKRIGKSLLAMIERFGTYYWNYILHRTII